MDVGVNIDLKGHTLKVEGDLLHYDGIIVLNGGTLEITGSYYMRSNTSAYGRGQLSLQIDADTVTAGTDFTILELGVNGKNAAIAGDMI